MQTHNNAGRKLSPFILSIGWETKVLAMYGQGASDREVRCWIKRSRGGHFSQHLWYRWLRDEPEFAEIIDTGRVLAEAWWLRIGRECCVTPYGGPKINARLWIMNMKNRFGWK